MPTKKRLCCRQHFWNKDFGYKKSCQENYRNKNRLVNCLHVQCTNKKNFKKVENKQK